MDGAQHDYRQILKREFDKRARVDSRFTMTAYAKELELSPGRLCEVLQGRQGLSKVVAAKIGKKLALNSEQVAYFCDLVEAEHGRSQLQRDTAQLRVENKNLEKAYQTLGADAFRAVADWHHFALLRLMTCTHFVSDVRWMADELSLSVAKVRAALSRLKRIGLVSDKSGKWECLQESVTTTTDIPSAAIRSFHRQILGKAEAAIEAQPVDRRDLSAIIFPMDHEEIAVAKRAIEKFRRNLSKKMSAADERKALYCLSIQFFSLNPEKIKERKR